MESSNVSGSGEIFINRTRVVFSDKITPFFTVEPMPGQTDLMQKINSISQKDKMRQAIVNLKRWDKDLPLISTTEALHEWVKNSSKSSQLG